MFRKERRKHDHGECLGALFRIVNSMIGNSSLAPTYRTETFVKFEGPTDSWKSVRCRLSAWLGWTPHSAASWTCDPTR
jgi:hypothetical protein